MFSSRNGIDNFQELIVEIKKYFELQKDYVRLEIISKLTILFSTLIAAFVLFLLSMIVILFLSFTLTSFCATITGSYTIACAIVAGCFVIAALVIYMMRHRWIEKPLVNFLSKLFFDK